MRRTVMTLSSKMVTAMICNLEKGRFIAETMPSEVFGLPVKDSSFRTVMQVGMRPQSRVRKAIAQKRGGKHERSLKCNKSRFRRS